MGEGKANHPAAQERSPQGGSKDMSDLSDIKGIQEQGMKDRAGQIDKLPEHVMGEHTPKFPQKR